MNDFELNLNKLKTFAKTLGYQVVETDCDSWDFNSKIICHNIRRTNENRIIYLAHECGHASLYNKHQEYYFSLFPGFDGSKRKKKTSELEQEVLAWSEGLTILSKLAIQIDIARFAKIKTLCLQDYIYGK